MDGIQMEGVKKKIYNGQGEMKKDKNNKSDTGIGNSRSEIWKDK